MKRLHTKSQNFLKKPQLIKTLIGHSTIKKSDTVYDLGAGSGIISYVLADKCANVVAVEQDPRMLSKLRENLSEFENVTIVDSDILIATLPKTPFKVFANIPFHLSSPIVRGLTERNNPPVAIYLILQKQFAEKLLVESDQFTGLLGALITPIFTARIRYKLERSDYSPPPAVETVMIELLLRDTPLIPLEKMADYRAFVEQCFSRQKYFATFNLNKRPSELTTKQWVSLFTSLR
ncbi:methyltransferase domain-containing protein [Candidatus Saccharibacteria bacterium]|nr:methyltransferase domain-containing protein [Candidatus Saccharibacteria bacterium]